MTASRELRIGQKIAEGREAEVFADDGDTAILKLFRPGYGGHAAEEAALSRLDGSGAAPRLLGAIEIDGRHGLLLERLAGADMLALLERRPWRLRELARRFAEAQARIHAIPAPADLPDLREALAGRIDEADAPAELRAYARRVLDQLPAGDRLCHGDLHPGNVLVAADQARVIDWTNATRGVPAADHARTMLLLEQAQPLPGTSLLFRGLMATGRSAFAGIYARAYRRRVPGGADRIDSWRLVSAAARLAEGIAQERPWLIAYLDRARVDRSPAG